MAFEELLDDLRAVVYRYYKRGTTYEECGYDPDTPPKTEENRRLVAARLHAGSGLRIERWRDLLRRLQARHQRVIQDDSLHLPLGGWDAGYSGWLVLVSVPSREPGHHSLGFLVSFLVPYYVLYSFRVFVDEEAERRAGPTSAWSGRRPLRSETALTFTGEEEPYAAAMAAEIEATYAGYQPMPPAVGRVLVPDVFTGNTGVGEATLFDCLFTDTVDWTEARR